MGRIMAVRAKFRVTSIEMFSQQMPTGRKDERGSEVYERVELRSIKMTPVYSDDPASENRRFWQYSPTGTVVLGTVNPAAWEQFEIDGEYYLDFTKAEG